MKQLDSVSFNPRWPDWEIWIFFQLDCQTFAWIELFPSKKNSLKPHFFLSKFRISFFSVIVCKSYILCKAICRDRLLNRKIFIFLFVNKFPLFFSHDIPFFQEFPSLHTGFFPSSGFKAQSVTWKYCRIIKDKRRRRRGDTYLALPAGGLKEACDSLLAWRCIVKSARLIRRFKVGSPREFRVCVIS